MMIIVPSRRLVSRSSAISLHFHGQNLLVLKMTMPKNIPRSVVRMPVSRCFDFASWNHRSVFSPSTNVKSMHPLDCGEVHCQFDLLRKSAGQYIVENIYLWCFATATSQNRRWPTMEVSLVHNGTSSANGFVLVMSWNQSKLQATEYHRVGTDRRKADDIH